MVEYYPELIQTNIIETLLNKLNTNSMEKSGEMTRSMKYLEGQPREFAPIELNEETQLTMQSQFDSIANAIRSNRQETFELEFDETLQAMVLRILDTEGMYPCYFQDPEAGTYKIIKTSKGKLQMGK